MFVKYTVVLGTLHPLSKHQRLDSPRKPNLRQLSLVINRTVSWPSQHRHKQKEKMKILGNDSE